MQIGNAELRPYQAKDAERFLEQDACLVAYDKRGGKTITSLAIALKLQERGITGSILIISDKTNQWTENLSLIGIDLDSLHLVDRPRRRRFQAELENPLAGHFYQIHWAGLVPEFVRLSSIRWACIIADEAHWAKNRKAQRTKALKKLRTRYKIGLTADPEDNAPQDIWSLLNWLYPKTYTSFWRWVRKYVEVEKQSNKQGEYFTFGDPINVEEFQAEIEPFFTRLSLEEMDPDQVPTIYETVEVSMLPEQAEAYRQMEQMQIAMLDGEFLMAEWPMVYGMRLQQLAQSMGRVEVHEEWKTRQVLNPTTGKRERVRAKEEVVSLRQIGPSPKVDKLVELLQTRADLGPTIVFSSYPGILELVIEQMDTQSICYASALTLSDAEHAGAMFQCGDVDIIVGTTGAIAESIKLDRADTEIFLDVPWSPRVRSQAEGRAKAVGKRTPVRIIDIKTIDTVDYDRLPRVEVKRARNDQLMGRTRSQPTAVSGS